MARDFTAPRRRVGYHVKNARNLNATGWAMFDAMVRWARPAGSQQGQGDLVWDLANATHRARGCDLWQTTWAPGGDLLTGSRLGAEVRSCLLGARELCVREAQGRPRQNPLAELRAASAARAKGST